MKNNPSQRSGSRTSDNRLFDLWPYGIIFLVALTVRLIYLHEIKDQAIFSILLGDAESYDTWAREILQKGWIGERTFYQAPFYPYFLALIYSIGTRDLMLIRLVQAVLGSASCVLLAGAGARFFNRKCGYVAGLLLALYAPALFFDLLIQKAVLGMFFMCALLYLMGKTGEQRNREERQFSSWLLMGVVLACMGLTRENALILIPVVVVWMIFSFRENGWRSIGSKGLLLALGLALIFSPVILRNYIVGGEFVLTTSQMGPNFFIGNSKDATGFYRPLIWNHSDWKFERSDAQDLAEKALHRPLSPNEVSDYWMTETLRQIRQAPLRWLRLMGKKWLMTWNSVEISDSESIYAHYRYSRLLNVLGSLLNFGVLCPLAIAGVFFTWKNRKKLWGLYAVWFCFAASVALFFIFDRYRHPMAAVMLLFAAAGLTHIYHCIRERRLQRLALAALLTVLCAVVINWPLVSKAKMEAPTYFNIGYELEKRGELDLARSSYLLALSLDDTNPLVLNNLGMVAMKQDRPADAIEFFNAAVAAKPDNWDARVNLGIALWSIGRKAEAVAQYQEVLSAVPDYNPTLYYNIACFYSLAGRTREGLNWLQRAIDHGYDKWDLLREDPDLENLRQQPEFSEILQQQ
jgi:tetratricopeptide (TPR) repeat protein